MEFCKDYSQERRWCQKYGLNVRSLPEEQQFREYILEFNFKQRREQLLLERELKLKLKEKYQRIKRNKMIKRRSEKLSHLAEGVTLQVLANSQDEQASTRRVSPTYSEASEQEYRDSENTPAPLTAVTKKGKPWERGKQFLKKQSSKAMASVKHWIRKGSDDHLPTITERGTEYNRRASSYVRGGPERKESKS
eukprot:CAMPEP_0170483716 /NCGR_PEP_ID=MMETSP0208-20121228/3341_1 /TAXON_ID=197538 /ORGANISM="Strombidium inclinatum, Strain S3" /LENGTH=192 /DNA_ID=CAMNT_0010756853 /DNA_START=5757 /DNA_END=6335 /DNA_ORIENTATION=-